MRTAELRELDRQDLEVRLAEAHEELFNLRFQNATGRLENYKRLNTLRKDIARIETVIREDELGIEHEVESEEVREQRPKRRLFRRRREEEAEEEATTEAEAEEDEDEPDDEAEVSEPEAAEETDKDETDDEKAK